MTDEPKYEMGMSNPKWWAAAFKRRDEALLRLSTDERDGICKMSDNLSAEVLDLRRLLGPYSTVEIALKMRGRSEDEAKEMRTDKQTLMTACDTLRAKSEMYYDEVVSLEQKLEASQCQVDVLREGSSKKDRYIDKLLNEQKERFAQVESLRIAKMNNCGAEQFYRFGQEFKTHGCLVQFECACGISLCTHWEPVGCPRCMNRKLKQSDLQVRAMEKVITALKSCYEWDREEYDTNFPRVQAVEDALTELDKHNTNETCRKCLHVHTNPQTPCRENVYTDNEGTMGFCECT